MNLPTKSVTAVSESAKDRLAKLLAAARAAKGLGSNSATPTPATVSDLNPVAATLTAQSAGVTYNEKQLKFVTLASAGESCVLMGAAGTGKTTSMRGTLESIIQSGRAGILDAGAHKHLRSGTPGIVVISFTRRAVANIRKNLPPDLQSNCLTYHALLQYEPTYYETTDPVTLETRKTMAFEPSYSEINPLPSSIRVCVIEEASMYSVEFFKILSGALGSHVQFILLGDIQQLKPVFGSAILGYKMIEWPAIELTQVYRQALESPIIRLAHRILSGVPIPASEYPEWKFEGKLTIHPWKKRLSADDALFTLAKFLKVAIDSGSYNPEEDMVLIPFNKSCGTLELNKHIAQHLARRRNSDVYEIVSGFAKVYFSVGDKVLVDKEDGTISAIVPNPSYMGAAAQPHSPTLDYWGFESARGGTSVEHHLKSETEEEIEFLLSQTVALGGSGDSDERVRQASHIVHVTMEDGREVTLSSAGDINALLHAFVLTVHKAQGSERRKVFFLLHHSHSTMTQRELLYTGVTRAREELYIICEPDTFTKGIKSQQIIGNTIEEKAEYFKGKVAKEEKLK